MIPLPPSRPSIHLNSDDTVADSGACVLFLGRSLMVILVLLDLEAYRHRFLINYEFYRKVKSALSSVGALRSLARQQEKKPHCRTRPPAQETVNAQLSMSQ